jgi:peptidoglycan hydrolase-like protein with peptidoglycan-binding domain
LGSSRSRRSRRALQRSLALAATTCALVGVAAVPTVAMADDPGADSGAATSEVVLKKGDRGPAVKAVQRKLSLTADGKFGAGTARAVKQFQKRSGITADGIVGPATRQALKLRPFSARSVQRGKKKKTTAKAPSGSVPAVLEQIAQCESGGDPTAVSKDGRYYGKYQFSKSTWAAQGGQGDNPAEAPESEQDRVATKLYKASGTASWPTCGSSAGSD